MDNNGSTALFYGDIRCVQLLLQKGASVNKLNNKGHNAMQSHIVQANTPFVKSALLLYAAGETIDGITINEKLYGKMYSGSLLVPDYLFHKDLKLNLKHLAREAVRKHLINIDPHENLCGRIHHLELPSLLTEYLLYNMSLDDNVNDDDNDDNDNDKLYNKAQFHQIIKMRGNNPN